MAAATAAAEAAVKKLARMGGNTICPNCGTEKKFGFGSVCMKFLTFVCNECKSSHQAISHRCKSLTMSSWTEGEVLQLRTVGGNDRARATWLATAPPPGQNGRPVAGSSIDLYKSFIVDVYERKNYYRETASVNDVGVTNTESQQRLQPPTHLTANSLRQKQLGEPNLKQGTKFSNPPVVVDLLDFGEFETAAASEPLQASSNISAVGAPAPQTASFDPFGTGGGSNSSNMYGFGSSNSTANSSISNSTGVGSFDPFGTASAAGPLSLDQRKTPIMSNSTANGTNDMEMMSNHPINTGMMHDGFGGAGSKVYLHGTQSSTMIWSGTGLPYHQQAIMQPSMNNVMMVNATSIPGQTMNNPGIMNATMTMNGATNMGISRNNGMYNSSGMGRYSGGGSTMTMQNDMGNPGGMVMNVMPGGNSMNRISNNFDGKSQQTAKPDPFANLGL
jgi:Putative GTPase activating protein for Arf